MKQEQAMVPEAEFRSYYGQPVIKAPVWHEPHMPVYLYLGGLSGAASVMGAMAGLTGYDRLALTARVTAALGAAAGAGFLVAELGRPERFLNMLRIFKPSSPMSMGSWTLAAHSTLTAAAAASALLAPGQAPERPLTGQAPERPLTGPVPAAPRPCPLHSPPSGLPCLPRSPPSCVRRVTPRFWSPG